VAEHHLDKISAIARRGECGMSPAPNNRTLKAWHRLTDFARVMGGRIERGDTELSKRIGELAADFTQSRGLQLAPKPEPTKRRWVRESRILAPWQRT
jgi:hypothetical protein